MNTFIKPLHSIAMEIEPTSLWLFFAISALVYYYFLIIPKSKASSVRLPPGPTPLPLVGNLFDIGSKPHRSLARLARTYGPVMSIRLGGTTFIVVSSPTVAREALQTKDQTLSSRGLVDAIRVDGYYQFSLLCMEPNTRWKNLRALLKSHIFTSQNLDSNQSLRRQKVRDLVEHVRCRTGRPVNIGWAAFGTGLNLIANTFFSTDLMDLNSEVGQEFRESIEGMFEMSGIPNLVDAFPFLRLIDPQGLRRTTTKHVNRLYKIVDQLVDNRLQDGSRSSAMADRDLLDSLLRFHDGESTPSIDRATLRTFLVDMFIGGSETASTTVEWAMAELLRHPSYLARARTELAEIVGKVNEVEEPDIPRLPFLQAVVKETFRLHGPLPLLLPHQAMTTTELGGYTMPEKSLLLINVWAMGRDGNVWDDPESFKPERFLGSKLDFHGRHFELIPFGSGRRQCPGLPLAHRMVHLMLASLLHSFDWGLPEGMKPEDVDFTEKFKVTVGLAVPVPAVPLPSA